MEMKPNAKSMKARIRISKSLFMETGTSVAIIYEIAGFEEHQSVDTASLCKHLRFLLVSSGTSQVTVETYPPLPALIPVIRNILTCSSSRH